MGWRCAGDGALSLTDANHIAYQVTVDDSKMYTQPRSNHCGLDRLKPGDHRMDEGHLRPGPTVVPFTLPSGQK